MNLALASAASPRNVKRPRAPGEDHGANCTAWKGTGPRRRCLQTRLERAAKWRNFGPWVVDLGPRPPSAAPDARPAAHGNDLALLFERLWFIIFDPTVQERLPGPAECFTEEAVAAGLLRCGDACPSGRLPVGCALSDARGASQPPAGWEYAPGRRRCLSEGCMVVEAGAAHEPRTDVSPFTAWPPVRWSSLLPACSV